METAMTMVRSQNNKPLETKIQTRFAKFNQKVPPAKGRRYPKELRELVKQGRVHGLSAEKICQLTGISKSTAIRLCTVASKASAKRSEKIAVNSSPKGGVIVPRRLEVVGFPPDMRLAIPVVVRFTSGVTIELYDTNLLTADLLKNLQTLGVTHASSC